MRGALFYEYTINTGSDILDEAVDLKPTCKWSCVHVLDIQASTDSTRHPSALMSIKCTCSDA